VEQARPAKVTALAWMHGMAAACCALTLLRPMSTQAPTRLSAGLGVLLALTTVGLLVARRVPDRVLHLLVGTSVLAVTALVATAATPQGSTITGVTYTWITLYGAYYFSRRGARLLTAANAVAYAAALLVNPFPGAATAWGVVTMTSLLGSERFSALVQRLRDDARTDRLTGALNRAGLEQAGPTRLAESDRRGEPLTVAVIDLDGFKQVNDTRGHAAGDQLLVDTTDHWREVLRGEDVLARSGGDEFVLLLSGTTRAEAREVLGRLRAGSPSAWSYGLALHEPGEPLERAVASADRELYLAKSARQQAVPVPTQRTDGTRLDTTVDLTRG
jgi:diguanylate cyclase (GGDEF)-like protein